MMDTGRKTMLRSITDHLGARKLVWVGTRGHDALSFLEIPQFSESYAIIAQLGSVSLDVDFTLEEVSSERADLDTYKIDNDRSTPAQELRKNLLGSLNEPAVVAAYRPFALLSALCYPRGEFVTYLGMFHERQATFEHKPWVEGELRKLGICVLEWRYFANEDRSQLEEYVAGRGAVVVRTNRSDGGAGLQVVRDHRQVSRYIPHTSDGFFSAGPYLTGCTPLNINACVFRDGKVSLHPPSLQIIGVRSCTSRQFGYCGNDFSAIKLLARSELKALESMTLQTGRWLHSQGYLGAFGLDALLHEGKLLLVEINPRFQGSSLLSARLDRSLDRPDVYLCHLAAYFGQPAPSRVPLDELVKAQEERSQVVLHNNTESALSFPRSLSVNDLVEVELSPPRDISIKPNAIVLRAICRGSATDDGYSLRNSVACALDQYLSFVNGRQSELMSSRAANISF